MVSGITSALQITTTLVVSASDWVSRTTVNGRGIAMAVGEEDGSLWLASAATVLAPDLDAIRRQAEQRGGPPARQSKVTLAKVVLEWPHDHLDQPMLEPVTLRMPRVVLDPLGEVAVIAVPATSPAAALLGDRDARAPTHLDDLGATPLPEAMRVSVASLFRAEDGTLWDITRSTTLASAPTGGFAGRPGVVALDLSLAEHEQGAPVMACCDARPRLVGLTIVLHGGQAAMVLAERIAHIIHGAAGDPPGGTGR